MKNKFIKSFITTFILMLSVLVYLPTEVNAAGFSISSSTTTVYVGDSFTVRVHGNVAGRFDASVSGGALTSSSSVFIDNVGGGASFTIKATQVGNIYVQVTATDATDANYNAVTGSQGINVKVINRPSGGNSSGGGSANRPSGGNTSTNVPEEEEVDVTLKSLSVSEGSLTPEFSASTHNYEVVVGNKVEKLEVKAEANDENAKVEGTGEITLKEVETKVEVKVINEDESDIYTIKIVKETPVVYVGDYGVLNEFRNADILEGFEDYKIQIDGVEVIAKKNPANDLVVVYALNKEDQKSYYIYNEKKNKITSIYKPIALLGNKYVMISIPKKYKEMEGFKFKKVKIGEQEFEGWSFENKEFKGYSLLYFMDQYGKEHFYQYEESEQTLQIYNGSAPVTQKDYDALHEEMKMYQLMTYILAPTAGIIGIAALSLAFIAKKKNRK